MCIGRPDMPTLVERHRLVDGRYLTCGSQEQIVVTLRLALQEDVGFTVATEVRDDRLVSAAVPCDAEVVARPALRAE